MPFEVVSNAYLGCKVKREEFFCFSEQNKIFSGVVFKIIITNFKFQTKTQLPKITKHVTKQLNLGKILPLKYDSTSSNKRNYCDINVFSVFMIFLTVSHKYFISREYK